MAIRVLIVDDSSFFRRRISEIITSDGSMEVAGSATNGREAVKMAAELRPDVITMDVEMPIMDGINAVKGIMSSTPTPIIMFSSLTKESADTTFNALEAGALDFITKNFDDIARNKEQAIESIRNKIKDIAKKRYQVVSIARSKYGYDKAVPVATSINTATPRTTTTTTATSTTTTARSTVSTKPTTTTPLARSPIATKFGASSSINNTASTIKPVTVESPQKTPVPVGVKEANANTFKPSGKSYSIVAIGSSTGGPVALQTVLTKIPANFPLPIVVVQHMPATFTTTFAARLDKMCKIHVVEAKHGDRLLPGYAYLAPGGKQLYIDGRTAPNYTLKVAESDASINFKPCVDLTFASINNAFKHKVLAMILTGMGSDGCNGCRLLKQSGSTIWAQNEETCVIYGMPQAIVNASIAQLTLPIQDLGDCIVKEIMTR